MKLTNTKKNLEILAGRDSMNVEEMLRFIHEFFRDIHDETGIISAKAPAADIETLYDHLPWLMRTSLKIAETNKDRILDPSRKKTLEQYRVKIEELDKNMGREAAILRDMEKTRNTLQRKEAELEEVYKEERNVQAECEKLQKDIESLYNIDLPQVKRRRNELFDAKAKLSGEIAQQNSLLLDEQRKVQEQKDLYSSKEKELAGACQLKAELAEKVRQAEAAIDGKKAEQKQEEERLSGTREELNQISQKLQKIGSDRKALENVIRSIQENDLPQAEAARKEKQVQRDEMQSIVAEVLKKVEEAAQEIAGLSETRKQKQQELDSAAAEKERVEKDIRQILKKTEQEKEDRNSRAEELRKKTEAYRKEESETRTLLQEENRKCGQAEAELEKIRTDLQAAEKKLELLQDDTEDLQDQLEELDRKKRKEEENIVSLRDQLGKENRYRDSLDESISKIKKDLEELKGRNDNLNAFYREHREEKERLERQITSVNQAAAGLQKEISLLQQDIEKKDYKAQEARLLTQKKDLMNLQKQFEQTKKECVEKEAEITSLQKELQNQQNRLQILNDTRFKLQKEKNDLIDRTEKLDKQVKELDKWLNNLDARQYMIRCQLLGERAAQIEKIRRNVENDWFSDWRRGNQAINRRGTCTYAGEALQENLEDMQKSIEKYKAVLNNVIECMSSEKL